MEKKMTGRFVTGIKVMCIAVWAMACMMMTAFKADQLYNDVFSKLGLKQESCNDGIRESFFNGYLQFYGARNIKNIVFGDREAVAKDLLTYTKQYVKGPEFRKAYEEYRRNAKPSEPAAALSDAEVKSKYIAETRQAVKNLEDGIKTTTNQELLKYFKESLEMLKKTLKEAEEDKSEILNMLVEGNKSTYQYQKKNYDNDIKEWEVQYPQDPDQYVKQRLVEMLEATENVDFSAQLVDKNGRKYFVNKTYEGKPNNWKLAFRAGKEVTGTARNFASEWLKELK